MSWILLIKGIVEGQLELILPLNYTDHGDTPDRLWESKVFNERILLVLTEDELAKETERSDSITVEDILGLYSSALRAEHAN